MSISWSAAGLIEDAHQAVVGSAAERLAFPTPRDAHHTDSCTTLEDSLSIAALFSLPLTHAVAA